MHKKDCSRFRKKWLSQKVVFRKAANTRFFAISSPKIALFPFWWTVIRKSAHNGLKRVKREKRHFAKFNISLRFFNIIHGGVSEYWRTFASYPKRGDIDFTDCKTQKDKIADRGACIPM